MAICRTLVSRPTLLLADEPVASLDAEWATRTLQILSETHKENGGSIICSLHDEEQVQQFADFVIRLSAADPTAWSWESISREEQS